MALDFFAGCLGGCAGVLVGHPFDTIKVRLQTQDFRNPQYKGAVNCFTSILKKESVGGLYKGMTSPMAGVAVVNAIVFGVYGNFQRHLPQPDALSSHFLAGAAAGFVQSFVCSPMELVKTRLQLQQNCEGAGTRYSGPINCITQVAKAEGFRGIFRGLGTTICREVPGFGTYFFAYELMTRPTGENGEPGLPISTLHMLLAGGISGTVSWVLTYPIDVIKSRLQVDGMGGAYKYNGFMDCLKKSIQTEGYRVMTRGLTSTIMRAFPTNAATFTVVTWVIRWANDNHVEDTSGYIIAEFVDITASETFKVQKRSSVDARFGIKVFGLLENFESKEKYMHGIFQWRKIMIHNLMGTDVFCSQQQTPESSQIYSSGKEDSCQLPLSEKTNEYPCLQCLNFEISEKDSIVKEKEQQLSNEVDSEEQESTDDPQHHKDSKTENEPNTYEHKNDYYNSSVR